MTETEWIIHPKEIAKQCGHPGDILIGPKLGKQVCVVFTDSKEEEAYAHKISAALEMYEALECLVEIERRDNLTDPDLIATDEWRERVWVKARAAIAKAKGE